VGRNAGVVFDQAFVLQGHPSAKHDPESFRGIRYKDPETGKRPLFIPNNTALPAQKVSALYKARWQVELFFRSIKQHLRIEAFFGTSENAVKPRIGIAGSVSALVGVGKKRLGLSRIGSEIRPILSLNRFEKTPLDAALTLTPGPPERPSDANQLILFHSVGTGRLPPNVCARSHRIARNSLSRQKGPADTRSRCVRRRLFGNPVRPRAEQGVGRRARLPVGTSSQVPFHRMEPESCAADAPLVLELMFRLGQAYLACGEQTAQVERLLRRVATAYGMRRSRVVTFPTAVFITLHDGVEERITLAEGPAESLRLDQIADVYALGTTVQGGGLAPREALEQLARILRTTPRFGTAGIVMGHTILTLGLAMVVNPALTNLAAAALLGTIVGSVKALNRKGAVLSVPLSVVAAAIVSGLVFFAVRRGLPVDPLYALVPPLITFLPGAMLTLAMVELAYGDMVSGSSRLITGFVQLVLLAFGLAAGAALVGVKPDSLLESTAPLVDMPWAPWAGVVVFGIGVYFHFSAPRNSFLWMLLVLVLTFAAQRFAATFVGSEISGFFGTLVATPLGYLIQLRFRGPPSMVTFLPSFWLLVPGSLGLLSVTRMLSDRSAGLEGLIAAVFILASIALGTLMGASLYKSLTERFNVWQLQIGRVGTYLRRERER